MATTISSRGNKAKVPQKTSGDAAPPSEDNIRLLAYRLYEKRVANGASGDASSDWIEAERLLVNDPVEGSDFD